MSPRTAVSAESGLLAERVRGEILRAIRNDEFTDGRLPPESELAGQLGVSRGTLRSALQALSAEGIVSRRPRHGTVVNQHLLQSTMQLNRLVSFSELLHQVGHKATTHFEPHQIRQSTDAETQALDLESGTAVIEINRVVSASGRPVISTTDVVPAELLGDRLATPEPADTLLEFLRVNADIDVDYATTSIVPCVASTGTPTSLRLADGTAYVQLHETFHTRDHQRVALSVVSVADQALRLTLVRRGR